MMYWKSMLLGGLLAASAGLSADEAVRLTNPDFEKGTVGWAPHGTAPKEAVTLVTIWVSTRTTPFAFSTSASRSS
ncbi:MAG: hypothetical protein J6S73_06635 [Lentisphaeria bacterium]|nr:hypothetical protein [Lentisphaeria bacterium]